MVTKTRAKSSGNIAVTHAPPIFYRGERGSSTFGPGSVIRLIYLERKIVDEQLHGSINSAPTVINTTLMSVCLI